MYCTVSATTLSIYINGYQGRIQPSNETAAKKNCRDGIYSWGSGGAVSLPVGPGQIPGGSPGGKAPRSSSICFIFEH